MSVKDQATTVADCYTPEDYFMPRPAAAQIVPVDAVVCAAERSLAIVQLLMCQFDGGGGMQVGQRHMVNALWALQGNLEQINRMMLNTVPVVQEVGHASHH